MSLESLMLKHIRLDGDTQTRVKMSDKLIDEYARQMAEGDDFPPLAVMFDGVDHWLYDGFHRYYAAVQLGRERLPVEVKEGTREDAIWESLGANKTHGLRFTSKDKAKAIRKALENWTDRTDGYIAKHIGVDEKTVKKYHLERISRPEIPDVNPRPDASTEEFPQFEFDGRPSRPGIPDVNRRPNASTEEFPQFAVDGRPSRPEIPDVDPRPSTSTEEFPQLAVDGRPSRPEFPDVTHAEKSPTAEIPQLTRRLGADGKWYKPRNKPIIGPDRRPAPPEPGALAKEPPERDMLGRPFEGPHAERMRQVFSFQPRIAQQVHLLGSLGGFMRDMAGDGHLVYGKIDLPRFHAGLRRAMSALMRICPHIICPRCRGAGCQVCRGWGWIDQWGWLSYGRRGRVGPAQENGEHEDHEDHKEHKERPRE